MSIRRVERLFRFTLEDSIPLYDAETASYKKTDDEQGAETTWKEMEPPRLQARGVVSRLATAIVCCLCFAAFIIPIIRSQFFQTWIVPAKFYRSSGSERQRPKLRPQPAILRRFRRLKRSPQHRGVDSQAVLAVFPSWQYERENVSVRVAVGDIALAIATLTERLDTIAAMAGVAGVADHAAAASVESSDENIDEL